MGVMTATSPTYSERVAPSLWWWVIVLVLSAMTSLMVVPVWKWGAVIVPVAIFVVVALILRSLTPTVTVTDTTFYAGPAHIERSFITDATPLKDEEAFKARGQNLDARAFLVTRPWAKPLVKVTIEDPQDPTPYWLVSTRHPEKLARALSS